MSLRTFLEKMQGIGFIELVASGEWGEECISAYDIEDINEISEDLLDFVVDKVNFEIFDGYNNSHYITATIYLT